MNGENWCVWGRGVGWWGREGEGINFVLLKEREGVIAVKILNEG